MEGSPASKNLNKVIQKLKTENEKVMVGSWSWKPTCEDFNHAPNALKTEVKKDPKSTLNKFRTLVRAKKSVHATLKKSGLPNLLFSTYNEVV